VQSLACYDTPSQVAAAVNMEFGIDIERQQVARYDPTKKSGDNLAKKYRDIFDATRKAFIEDAINIPIASKTYRLRSLQRMHDYYVSRKNYVQAAAVLEQAAKEVGGMFNGKLHAPPSDNPLVTWLQQIGSSSLPVVHEVEGTIVGDDDDDDITTVAKSTPWKV
jgi:hypothetical protein